ncbi:hypothetical protein mRhiFer1_009010 [Rhinolophus ferrumequinum]|uniref:Uncharacterized protein n=1 Tax=Rhinolophus ferrumequinum TaxID=59479 RepID=A0A7J7SXL6_RHIFE|nr:hypothetical protein mRhiFer1_009010 [Rhinolophus ferrumequinum]
MSSSKLLIRCSASSSLLVIPSSALFISVIVFFTSEWFFFMVSMSFFFFMLAISLLNYSLRSLSILITIVLNSVSGRLLASILFSSFCGVFSCSFFGGHAFLCLLILAASLCCFYVLGRSATSPSLGQWPYVVGALWRPGTVSLVTCSRGISCVCCVCPPVIVEP